VQNVEEINDIERIIFQQADRFRAFSSLWPLSIDKNEERDEFNKQLTLQVILKEIQKSLDKKAYLKSLAKSLPKQLKSESSPNPRRNSPKGLASHPMASSKHPRLIEKSKEDFATNRTTAGTNLEKTAGGGIFHSMNEGSTHCSLQTNQSPWTRAS